MKPFLLSCVCSAMLASVLVTSVDAVGSPPAAPSVSTPPNSDVVPVSKALLLQLLRQNQELAAATQRLYNENQQLQQRVEKQRQRLQQSERCKQT